MLFKDTFFPQHARKVTSTATGLFTCPQTGENRWMFGVRLGKFVRDLKTGY